VVENAVATTRQLFEDGKVVLTVSLPDSVPPVVADRDRMIQVVLNILSNAAKYGGGRVALTLDVLAGAIRVDIKDQGLGIAPEDQERIFEKFRQAGDASSEKPAGTGLGLAISREIIQRFGGRLWVQSTPGRGATFSFTVPTKTWR
jgi:signal transduction histidine kinase